MLDSRQADAFDGELFDDPKMIEARNRVILALEQGPEPYKRHFIRKLQWLRQCGEFPAMVTFRNGYVETVTRNQCRCRGCPVCASIHAARIRRSLAPVIDERARDGRRFSLITLTMPHTAKDLAQKLVSHLMAAMRVFQRSASFTRYVRGWARGVEVPWKRENGYHAHAHYIVESAIWPKDDMKRTWTESMRSVGGPEVPQNGTHVKGLRILSKGLAEAVGYPFKLKDISSMPVAELCQLLFATKGRHLAQVCRKWSRRAAYLADVEAARQEALEGGDEVFKVSFKDMYQGLLSGHGTAVDMLELVRRHLAARPGSRALADNLFKTMRHEAQRRVHVRATDAVASVARDYTALSDYKSL